MRQPFLGQELQRQGIAVPRLDDTRHGHVGHASSAFGDPHRDELLGCRERQRLELQGLERPDRAVGHQRARTWDRSQLVGPRCQNQQESRAREFARHDVEDRDRRVVGRVDIVDDKDQRTFLGSGLDRLEEAVGQAQWNDVRRPLHGLRHAGEHGEDLR